MTSSGRMNARAWCRVYLKHAMDGDGCIDEVPREASKNNCGWRLTTPLPINNCSIIYFLCKYYRKGAGFDLDVINTQFKIKLISIMDKTLPTYSLIYGYL